MANKATGFPRDLIESWKPGLGWDFLPFITALGSPVMGLNLDHTWATDMKHWGIKTKKAKRKRAYGLKIAEYSKELEVNC